MLRRKYSVQKSFRIDAQLSEDLETLSEILDRPQNDLVNTALEELMLENKEWFIEDFLVEKFSLFFDVVMSQKYENEDILVDIEVEQQENLIKLSYTEKMIGETEEQYYDLSEKSKQMIKQELRDLSIYLNKNDEEVKEYLKRRLNYK